MRDGGRGAAGVGDRGSNRFVFKSLLYLMHNFISYKLEIPVKEIRLSPSCHYYHVLHVVNC